MLEYRLNATKSVAALISDPRFAPAFRYAEKAHREAPIEKNRLRKYDQAPYIVHPCAVAALVLMHELSDEAVVAALLHDVVEDTGKTPEDLLAAGFSPRVVDLVLELTDPDNDDPCYGEDRSRDSRKAFCRRKLALADMEAQSIKVCDLIDNTSDIIRHDPHFAVKYLEEKVLLLDVLTKAHPALLAAAKKQVLDGQRALVQMSLDPNRR